MPIIGGSIVPVRDSQTHALLHGQERTAFGDASYQGVEKRPENQGKTIEWLVAMKRSVRKVLSAEELGWLQVRFEKLKASIRAKVEHPFHVIKNLFRHRKTASLIMSIASAVSLIEAVHALRLQAHRSV